MKHIISPTGLFKGLSSGSSLYTLDLGVLNSELPLSFVQSEDLQEKVEQPVEEQKQPNIPAQCIVSGCKRYDENGCLAYPGYEHLKWENDKLCPLAPFNPSLVKRKKKKVNQKHGGVGVLLPYRTDRGKTYKKKGKNREQLLEDNIQIEATTSE